MSSVHLLWFMDTEIPGKGRPSGSAMVILEIESMPREDSIMWKVNPVTFLCSGLLVALQRPSKLFVAA